MYTRLGDLHFKHILAKGYYYILLLIFHLTVLDFSPLHFGVQQEVKRRHQVRPMATSGLSLQNSKIKIYPTSS